MYYKDSLISQLAALKRREVNIISELSELPKEKLKKKFSHGRVYYYIFKDSRYIPLKADDEVIRQYNLSNELHLELAKIQNNIKLLSTTIKNYVPIISEDNFWDDLGSEANPFLPEHKVHKYKGVLYRSKSEAMIASMLTSYGIEFKYEPALDLNGHTIYPDFVIKRPRDGKIIIWEHSGIMMKPGAIEKFTHRLKEYHENDYYLWDNLIYTFDTELESLNVDMLQKIIEVYLL